MLFLFMVLLCLSLWLGASITIALHLELEASQFAMNGKTWLDYMFDIRDDSLRNTRSRKGFLFWWRLFTFRDPYQAFSDTMLHILGRTRT